MECRKFRIYSMPFEPLTMPSVDIATLKACLEEKQIPVEVNVICAKFAEFIGPQAYQNLLNSPILGDAVFAGLLFPSNVSEIKKWIKASAGVEEDDFDALVEHFREFFMSYVQQMDKHEPNEVFYFHMYKRQLFPSLYLAKLISQVSNNPIWLGGHHCKGECGKSLQQLFPFVDRTFGQDIEASIINALLGEECELELDDFPTPDYSDFIYAVDQLPHSHKKVLVPNLWLQVEVSRGCWWNKCSFCTLNAMYSRFQPKSIDNIIRDFSVLQEKYKTTQILINEYNSDDNWKELILSLNKHFPGLKGTHYLLFKVSKLLSEEDWRFLKENDVPILIGIESLSSANLEKINKGQTVIECLQVIKFAERYGVKCCYNLMCGLPFENESDFIEAERVIQFIKHCIPPFDLEIFRLTNGSAVQRNPAEYCVEHLGIRQSLEGMLIPKELQSDYIPFFLEFESTLPGLEKRKERWNTLIQDWIDFYYDYAKSGRPKLHSALYMRKNEYVLDIYDSRYGKGYSVYSFSGLQRAIYEYCNTIRSFSEIVSYFNLCSEEEIMEILNSFVEKKLMFKEEANFLSLAI